MYQWLAVVLASLSPIMELRGSIPLGVALGLDPISVIVVSFIANSLVFFPVYFGLEFLYERYFIRFARVKRLHESIHKKGKKVIDKWGIPGLLVFVAIPLPGTGAWTATFVAWLIDLDWKKSFVAITAGVGIAAIIVGALVLGVVSLV